MSVTSDSGPDVDQEESSDALDSPAKASSPLLKEHQSSTASNSSNSTLNKHHVLIRQKASYKNSLDV